MGSCGGYMAARFHQLQTLYQFSGRPRSLREAGEAGKKKQIRRTAVPDCKNFFYTEPLC